MESPQGRTVSKDGTSIAFERFGAGPAIVLVSPALADRSSNIPLSKLLARNLTVLNYDRRGRGASSDTQPYAVEREIEDIEALIDAAGGTAYVFGSSSGAVLALEAAAKLGKKVKALLLYEPPFLVDDSHPPLPTDYLQHLHELIAAERRGEAVEYFMSQAVGVPKEMLEQMHNDPMWPSVEAAAHTLPYEGQVMGDTMSGKPLPAHRWDSVKCPTLVMTGEKSPPFLQNAARAAAAALPKASLRILEGCDHSAVTSTPLDVATTMYGFFFTEHFTGSAAR